MESQKKSVTSRSVRFGPWYFAAIIIAILLTIPGLGEKKFYTRGEPREALVVDQMVRTGNYILPHAYGGALPSKPPMMHWIAAGLSLPGGQVTELTARLPSALASILLVVYIFPFIAARSSARRAFLAALFTVSSFEWWRSATTARVDTLLAVLITLALLEFYRWRERELRGLPIAAVLLLAAATLTKGPVGIVLAGGILGVFLLLTGVPFIIAAARTAIVMLAAALIASLWYLAAYRLEPGPFAAKFYYENIARFLGQMEDDAHRHSAPYLLATLLYGMLPWIVPAAIASVRSGWEYFKGKGLSTVEALKQSDRLILFSALSAAAIIVFFCIPGSKRSVYLLPAYPFIAVLFAAGLDSGAQFRSWVIERWAALLLGAAAIVAGLAGVAVVGSSWVGGVAGSLVPPASKEIIAGAIAASPVFGTVMIFSLIVLAGVAVVIRALYDRPVGPAVAVMWVMLLAGANIISTPFANQLGNDRFAEQIRPLIEAEPATPLYSFGQQFFGASFYLNRRIDYFDPKNPQTGFVLTTTDEVEAVEGALPAGFKAGRAAEGLFPDTKPGMFPVLLRISPLDAPAGDSADPARP